jgi:hypothetical protein
MSRTGPSANDDLGAVLVGRREARALRLAPRCLPPHACCTVLGQSVKPPSIPSHVYIHS